MRLVPNEQWKHGTSDEGALLIEVHEHCYASPLDQRALGVLGVGDIDIGQQRAAVLDVGVRRPTLDDVFGAYWRKHNLP